jgi:hypothetical protein
MSMKSFGVQSEKEAPVPDEARGAIGEIQKCMTSHLLTKIFSVAGVACAGIVAARERREAAAGFCDGDE